MHLPSGFDYECDAEIGSFALGNRFGLLNVHCYVGFCDLGPYLVKFSL